MARELGMNQKKRASSTSTSRTLEAPLPEFIEHLYFKRVGKRRPGSSSPLTNGSSPRRGGAVSGTRARADHSAPAGRAERIAAPSLLVLKIDLVLSRVDP